MRIAVFTNQFPSRVCTFFARDMRALIEAGIAVDVFPIYPLDATLWRYVPDTLNEQILPRAHIHHVSTGQMLRSARLPSFDQWRALLPDLAAIGASAARFGLAPLAKSAYIVPKALVWAQRSRNAYDHVLAYWGNYAATCAYLFHRLIEQPIPFSLFLHAGTDLYREQVYLQQKLHYADAIITECHFNRQFMQQLYPDTFALFEDKIAVNYMGLDFAEFPYCAQGHADRSLLAVGSFHKVKGFDYLLRAVHALKCRNVEVQLELVGDGQEAAALRALAEALQITDRVTFRGWLLPPEVRGAMQRATIFVHPSNGLGDAMPNVIKEAMALGAPVVASQVAGIPELLNNGACGILVPPRDVPALADAIELLLARADLRQRYALAARAYAEAQFHLWHNGQRLANLLRATTRRSALTIGPTERSDQ